MSEVVGLKIQVDSNAGEAVGSLRSQLRQAQADVAALSDKFGVTSKEAIAAAKRAGELRDKISDAKNMADAFNPDAKFKALTASLSGVAGGFAAVQGAMGLMGVESKDLEKQLVKVQSAMAISQGLQSMGEAVDSFKQLGAVIKDKVVTAFSTLKGAIAATGLGLLAIAIGYVAANFDKVKESVLKLMPGLETVGKWIGKLIETVTDFVGVTSDASRELDKMKESAGKSLKENQKLLDLHGDQMDEWQKKRIEARNKYYQDVQKGDYSQKELQERLNRELEQIEIDRGKALQKVADDASKKRYDKEVEAYNKRKALSELSGSRLTGSTPEETAAELQAEEDRQKQLTDIQNSAELERKYNSIETQKQTDEYLKTLRKLDVEDRMEAAAAIADLMSGLSALIGQETATGKALSIASSIINTYESAWLAFKNAQKNPISILGTAYPYIAAATAIAAGLKNVQQIMAVQLPKGAGSGGSAPTAGGYSFSSGGGAPINPSMKVTTTSLSQGTMNQLQAGSMRAYVVESDITENQARIKRIEGAAVFGG